MPNTIARHVRSSVVSRSGMRRRFATVLTAAAAVAALTVGVDTPVSAASGGPIILMGIDAEDGGVGGHGPISTYVAVVNSVLGSATNGGAGILVVGCTTAGADHVSLFWQAIASGTGVPVTCAEGAAAIAAQSFAGFKMVAVASDALNTPNGGLTQAENDALGTRFTDMAAFINTGGGLLGFSSARLVNPYAYLGGVGSFTFATPPQYNVIVPTAAGLAVGITTALSVSAWHDEYLTFPSFLSVLATSPSTNAAAIGGAQVIVVPVAKSDLSLVKSGPTLVTEGGNFSYTLTVTNNGPDPATGVTVTDAIPANTTFVSAGAGCSEVAGTVTCTVASLAVGASAAFTITVTAGSVGTEIVNTATVAGVEADPNPTNNSSTIHTTLNHKPVCTAVTAGPDLWPPNHKLRTVTLTGATDADGNTLTWNVTAVTQDEPTNGLGDGDTPIDAVLGTGNTLQVRAERSGLGNGRVYRISYTVSDGLGGSCVGVATVGVPHDQSPAGRTPIDSGGVFNSLV